MKKYEEKVVTVFDHIEKGLSVVLDEVTDRVWKSSEPKQNSYLEIANSRVHTFDNVNTDRKYQQIKIEAMDMLRSIEKGELMEDRSADEMAEEKSRKESPKFGKKQGEKMGKQIELGERTY